MSHVTAAIFLRTMCQFSAGISSRLPPDRDVKRNMGENVNDNYYYIVCVLAWAVCGAVAMKEPIKLSQDINSFLTRICWRCLPACLAVRAPPRLFSADAAICSRISLRRLSSLSCSGTLIDQPISKHFAARRNDAAGEGESYFAHCLLAPCKQRRTQRTSLITPQKDAKCLDSEFLKLGPVLIWHFAVAAAACWQSSQAV